MNDGQKITPYLWFDTRAADAAGVDEASATPLTRASLPSRA